MNKDYLNINGQTIVSDEKGMHKKETHDKIAEELTLENEIEHLNQIVAKLEKEKAKLGTIEENEKARKTTFFIGILIIFFSVIMSKVLFFLTSSDFEVKRKILPFLTKGSDVMSFMMGFVGIFFTLPFTIFIPNEYRSKENRVGIIEEQLEYLYSEISKKKEELDTLRKNITKKEVIEDTDILSIDISDYRNNLMNKLALLECIKKHSAEFQKRLLEGTLSEALTEVGDTPENFELATKAIERTLNKK